MEFPVFITAHAGRFEHHRSIEREKLSTFSCHWDPFWSFDHFLGGSNHVYRWRECHLSWLAGAWLIDIDRFRGEQKEVTERSAAVFKCHVSSCDMRVSEAFCKLLVWDYTSKIPAGQKDVCEKVPGVSGPGSWPSAAALAVGRRSRTGFDELLTVLLTGFHTVDILIEIYAYWNMNIWASESSYCDRDLHAVLHWHHFTLLSITKTVKTRSLLEIKTTWCAD